MSARLHRMARRLIRLRGEVVTVSVEQAGSWNQYGEWTPGGVVERQLRAVTTPMPYERDIQAGGGRIDAGRVFWFASEVAPIRADADGDRIAYDGDVYRALAVEGWAGHWKVTAIRGEQIQ